MICEKISLALGIIADCFSLDPFEERIDFFINFSDSDECLLIVSVSFCFPDSCRSVGFLDHDDLLFALFVD